MATVVPTKIEIGKTYMLKTWDPNLTKIGQPHNYNWFYYDIGTEGNWDTSCITQPMGFRDVEADPIEPLDAIKNNIYGINYDLTFCKLDSGHMSWTDKWEISAAAGFRNRKWGFPYQGDWGKIQPKLGSDNKLPQLVERYYDPNTQQQVTENIVGYEIMCGFNYDDTLPPSLNNGKMNLQNVWKRNIFQKYDDQEMTARYRILNQPLVEGNQGYLYWNYAKGETDIMGSENPIYYNGLGLIAINNPTINPLYEINGWEKQRIYICIPPTSVLYNGEDEVVWCSEMSIRFTQLPLREMYAQQPPVQISMRSPSVQISSRMAFTDR